MPYPGAAHPGGQWMEMVVVDADQRVGETLSSIPSTRERRKPAQLHQQSSYGPHASQPYHRVAAHFLGHRVWPSVEQ